MSKNNSKRSHLFDSIHHVKPKKNCESRNPFSKKCDGEKCLSRQSTKVNFQGLKNASKGACPSVKNRQHSTDASNTQQKEGTMIGNPSEKIFPTKNQNPMGKQKDPSNKQSSEQISRNHPKNELQKDFSENLSMDRDIDSEQSKYQRNLTASELQEIEEKNAFLKGLAYIDAELIPVPYVKSKPKAESQSSDSLKPIKRNLAAQEEPKVKIDQQSYAKGAQQQSHKPIQSIRKPFQKKEVDWNKIECIELPTAHEIILQNRRQQQKRQREIQLRMCREQFGYVIDFFEINDVFTEGDVEVVGELDHVKDKYAVILVKKREQSESHGSPARDEKAISDNREFLAIAVMQPELSNPANDKVLFQQIEKQYPDIEAFVHFQDPESAFFLSLPEDSVSEKDHTAKSSK